MMSLTERELSRTQFKSMVVMVRHVVEEVCKDKDEATQLVLQRSKRIYIYLLVKVGPKR